MYRYKISSTEESSLKYGNCDICGKSCSEVYIQSEEKYYHFKNNGKIYEGWSQQGNNFGHKECLKSKRKE